MTQPLTTDAAQPAQYASIVLALGGGGARGLAQIGVIEVLQARGLYAVSYTHLDVYKRQQPTNTRRGKR